ncbi:PilZ domain-containing protein [Sphingomonas sp. BAUL-RG-20F-R05-02]|uniref:PilZ domain-containing protein n=1 Tax=Sphingomonas sp. BAUL-RG-20F-R05-02 TaxID=2914830 RepID=UPI001F591A79|nr:PilZ domain-containing protein [Sphingomonas sp. BAUL-RG-20F-R05-02]
MQRSDERTGSPTTGRVARRHNLFEPIEITVDRQSVRAHLLNVSATGALVHSAAPPALGATVKLKMLGIERSARVVWSKASRFGVAFDTELADPFLEAALR